MTALAELVSYLDAEMRTSEVPDYDGALNGLQLANGGQVRRIAAAVDCSTATIAGAIKEGADLLIVHHGMFWRGAQPVVGVAFERLKTAVEGGLAVYSSHIPLDLHPTLGNNVLLAKELALTPDSTFGEFRGVEIGTSGASAVATEELIERTRRFSARFKTTVVATPNAAGHRTRRWAIITGSGASSATIAEAKRRGVDTMIIGEGTHHTAVEAMENGLVLLYGGHYATETLGVQALARLAAERLGLSSVFVDVPTGL